MGWQDRDYNQSDYQRRGMTNPLWNILFGSLPLGRWFGIRVRVHASLIILLAAQLAFAETAGGMGIAYAAAASVTLFTVVLLHEFGHCFAARLVGGRAEDVLLWPLGGLAFTETAHRPWPRFVTVLGGPLVNVVLCLLSGAALWWLSHFHFSMWQNPLSPFGAKLDLATRVLLHTSTLALCLWWFYVTNLSLLLFNLLPIFPLDGGAMLQTILWPKFGYYRSMNFACLTGMFGAILMGLFGLVVLQWMLVFLGLAGFLYCFQTRAQLRAAGYDAFAEDDNEIDYSASLRPEAPVRRRIKRRWFRSVAKKAAREQAEQAKIDAILAKVHDQGLHSLTWWEKRA